MITLQHISIRILIKLAEAETPSDIADSLALTKSTVNHHLRRLVTAGLAHANYRTGVPGSYMFYSVTPAGMDTIRRLVVVV
jgi:DNA-binding MarR family transcriptional regulator